jgi:branched-chain amino acid transport system permease protein
MNFFILVIMATTWNLLAGYAGMVSIGQQGFVGRGAYATLYFAIKGVNPFVAIPLAILACGAIALPATWVIADSAMLIIASIALLGGGTGHYLPALTNLSSNQLNHYTYLATRVVALTGRSGDLPTVAQPHGPRAGLGA